MAARKKSDGPKLEQFTMRLTPAAKERLMAISQLEGETAYAILERAFWCWWERDLDGKKREAVERFATAVETLRD
ncbi:MAG: hypothetical protein AAF481_14455 [Acidobacteriota bacterium]